MNHAIQPTQAASPVPAPLPRSGRRIQQTTTPLPQRLGLQEPSPDPVPVKTPCWVSVDWHRIEPE
jgi:hypothetical protein